MTKSSYFAPLYTLYALYTLLKVRACDILWYFWPIECSTKRTVLFTCVNLFFSGAHIQNGGLSTKTQVLSCCWDVCARYCTS